MTDASASADALPPADERTAFSLKVRLYAMMFLQYFVQGCYLPIISVYLQDALDFNADQLGLFGSALAVGPLVAPVIVGQIVDRHFATERVLAFCHLVGGGLMLLLYIEERFWPILILGTLYSMLYVPSMMLTNALTFHHLKNRDREFPPIRLWGTVGFIVPAFLIEMYFLQGLEGETRNVARGVALALSGIAGVVMGLYCLSLPHTPPRGEKEFAPGKVAGLLKYRHFLVLVLVSLLVAIVHKFYFVWNSPYLRAILEQGGISGAWEQRIASIGQISEVAVMAALGVVVVRLGFKGTMMIGAAAYMLRCLVFAGAVTVPAPFEAVMTSVCIGQALHGLCFGCFLAAAYMYVDRVAPIDVRGSMQTLYGTLLIGLGGVLGGVISGRLGSLFTAEATAATLREQLGIAVQAGLIRHSETIGGQEVAMLRDWTGIWLAGGVMALVALIAFGLFFPSEERQGQAA